MIEYWMVDGFAVASIVIAVMLGVALILGWISVLVEWDAKPCAVAAMLAATALEAGLILAACFAVKYVEHHAPAEPAAAVIEADQ